MSDLAEYDHGPTKRARDDVIEKLKEHYAQDNLDFEVFEKRLEIATNTNSRRELYSLLEDLPVVSAGRSPLPSSGQSYSLNYGKVKEEEVFFALLSGTEKKGVWKSPRSLKIAAVLGGVDLDYTEAEIAPGVTEIDVFALMGGVDIVVPEGVIVEASGVPILGGFSNNAQDNGGPESPILRIRGFVIMGGVDVRVKKKKSRK